jgi:chromate reductase
MSPAPMTAMDICDMCCFVPRSRRLRGIVPANARELKTGALLRHGALGYGRGSPPSINGWTAMAKFKVAVLVGSLRKESFTRKIAKAMIELAPDTLDCQIVEIGALPLYNEDIEPNPPAAWVEFRKAVAPCDAVLFATPEYNRSIPGGLKNAIDVGSRPYGKSVFDGKAGAVISVSPGAYGGFGANHAIRNCFVFLNVFMLQQPEAYIAGVKDLLDESGKLKTEATRTFLTKYMAAFADWTQLIASRKKG